MAVGLIRSLMEWSQALIIVLLSLSIATCACFSALCFIVVAVVKKSAVRYAFSESVWLDGVQKVD